MEAMESPFIDPATTNNAQLAFLTAVYGVVLYQASNLIAGGSEMLQLVPPIAGIVGSIVLPILGAVPDGMMVLFSGVGPKAQETVAVGIGALAGSTVMLLTIPWVICIYYGRVPIGKSGKPDWSQKDKASLCGSGISFQDSIPKNAKLMLATTLLYFVIQVPSSWEEASGADTRRQAKGETGVAFWGLVACCVAFCGYLVHCFLDANEDKQLAEVIKGIEKKQISIGAALEFIQATSGSTPDDKEVGLMTDSPDPASMTRLKKICHPFFKRYDYDKDQVLSQAELKPLLHDLGYYPNDRTVADLLKGSDTNGDGQVNFNEFVQYLYTFMLDTDRMKQAPNFSNPQLLKTKGGDDDADEGEEMPEDLQHLSPPQQMMRVIVRSAWMMALGTFLILLFSDPMVDCLSEWGARLNVSPFYVSFVLAPFASNASELLAAYTYAVKKTERNMTTALSTLIGAACMNNTFVLGIFLAIVYQQQLAWQFTAEVIAMVLIQWIIGICAICRRTQTMVTAVIILLCYPGCLAVVWLLKNYGGLD